jgi:hypothetical protein
MNGNYFFGFNRKQENFAMVSVDDSMNDKIIMVTFKMIEAFTS